MIQDLNYQKISKPHEKNNDDYASVSILIHDEKEIIFIKRSEDLPTHKGHIAFPGGKKEVEDQSIVDTALREACEELLIDLKTITPIYPVVCLISDKPSSFNKSEVQNLYYVPIQELEKEKNWVFRGHYDSDWVFDIDGEVLWGATAKMVRNLLNITH